MIMLNAFWTGWRRVSNLGQNGKPAGTGAARTVPALRAGQGLFVAQICNLLYRRITSCWASVKSRALRIANGQPIANRRYSRVQLCATGGFEPLSLRQASGFTSLTC